MYSNIFGYNTIGAHDVTYDVLINNVNINISIPDLRYILIMHSYYLQYEEYNNGVVDMNDFLSQMNKTDIFEGQSKEYIDSIYKLFTELLPILQQLKQYQ